MSTMIFTLTKKYDKYIPVSRFLDLPCTLELVVEVVVVVDKCKAGLVVCIYEVAT